MLSIYLTYSQDYSYVLYQRYSKNQTDARANELEEEIKKEYASEIKIYGETHGSASSQEPTVGIGRDRSEISNDQPVDNA